MLSRRFPFFHFSLLALVFWPLVFEVHTDPELDRVEEGLTARESEAVRMRVSSESEIHGKEHDRCRFHVVVFSVLIWEPVGERGLYREAHLDSFE